MKWIQKIKWKMIIYFIGILWVLLLPLQTYASEEMKYFSYVISGNSDEISNDELYGLYVEHLFYGERMSTFRRLAGNQLSDDEKMLYDALVPYIRKIANGERVSSAITVGRPISDEDGIKYAVDTEIELDGFNITQEKMNRILEALLADLPYECYWYDKTVGCEVSGIYAPSLMQLTIQFTVAQNYRGVNAAFVDTNKTGAAKRAAAKAKNIVEKCMSLSDYEKLVNYKDEICSLVSYDHAAAEGGHFSTDNNPWQLISVFDGNPNTNVVCEGYSKAFMYLCDLTSFQTDVSCYIVRGHMDDEAHMWNIVTLEGKNYLVDVTNSDAQTIGESGSLFLAGGDGNVVSGYDVVTHDIETALYDYDTATEDIWGVGSDSILNLSNSGYLAENKDENNENEIAKQFSYMFDRNDITGEIDAIILEYLGTEREVVIPSMIQGRKVRLIGAWSFFQNKYLERVVIPDGVHTIDALAFAECPKLREINIPDSVQVIGEAAFMSCVALEKIVVPEGVTRIEDSTFTHCRNMQTISLPDSINYFGKYAFDSCRKLSSIRIPKGVTFIGEQAFYFCDSLTELILPSTLKKIERCAFSECSNLERIEIPQGITFIGEGAFEGCRNLKHIELPESVTELGDAVFNGCISLESVKLPSTLTSIGNWLFSVCSSLKEVTIPSGVTSIGEGAFHYCLNLTEITIPKLVERIGAETFIKCTALRDVYFKGDCCKIGTEAFMYVNANIYYPPGNSTWKSEQMKNYGGTLDWKTYCANSKHIYKNSECTKCGMKEIKLAVPKISSANVPSSGKIQLVWKWVEGAEKYQVYRSTTGKPGSFKWIYTTSGTKMTNTNVEPGKRYYYKVRCVDENGKTHGFSNVVSRLCDLSQPVVKMTSVTASGKPKITWNAVKGAVKYEVYRSTSGKSGTFQWICTTKGTEMVNANAELGKRYYYKVKALHGDKNANSAFSEVKSQICKLKQPVISVQLTASGKPKITWSAVKGAVKYEVYRSTSGKTGTFQWIYTMKGTEMTNTNVQSGKTYYYKVKALHSNSIANSGFSTIRSVRVK